MTPRSVSKSSGARRAEVTMSRMTSTAMARSLPMTRAKSHVNSLRLAALDSPPTASNAAAMSMAFRAGVPLNSRCSRKWVEPWWPSVSSREPTATQAPIVAERCAGIRSVSTRMPPGSTDRRMRLPSCSTLSSAPASPAGTSSSWWATSVVAVLAGAATALAALAATAPLLAGTLGLFVGLLAVGLLGGRLLRLVDYRVQRQLAARVDLGQLDLDLLADVEDVFDVLHALATDEAPDLRDVQEAVLTRRQRDEGAEGRRLDDGPDEALPHLWHLRVGDGVDRLAGGLGRRAVGRADVDGTVALDRDVGAGVLLDLVDHLALGADDLTDLVDGDLDGDDARSGGCHLVGGVDDLCHDVEDVEAGVARLAERAGQHGGREAVELGVQLDRGDEFPRSGHLEVHVTEGVFGSEDVGEGRVAGFAVHRVRHEPHGDARHRGAQRHACVEQREGRGAYRTHGGRAVGSQRLRHLADGVGEIFATRQERLDGAFRQRTVPDLAALGGTHAARLAGGVGREVVVVHVALASHRRKGVQLLFHAQHVEGGHAHDLGFAALEDRRTVHARKHVDLGGQCADVAQPTAVDAHAVGEHALADEVAGERTERRTHGLFLFRELLGQGAESLVAQFIDARLALLLAADGDGFGERRRDVCGHGLVVGVLVVEEAGEDRKSTRLNSS